MNISKIAEYRQSSEIAAPQRHRQHKPVETSEQPKKEDSVEISEEGRKRSKLGETIEFNPYEHPENNGILHMLGDREELKGLTGAALFDEANRIFREEGNMASMFDKASQDKIGDGGIFKHTLGFLWWKIEDKDALYDIAKQLSNLFDLRKTDIGDLATKNADKEAGKKLVEEMANKYLSGPDVQAFIDTINETIKNAESRNISYSTAEEQFVYNSLDGKMENAFFIAKQLSNMIFNQNVGTNLETKAIDREAGKKLAEYIAKNYLSGEDAKAFMNEINKYVERSELRDKGRQYYNGEYNGVQTVIDNAKLSIKNMSIENLLAKYSISLI